MMPACRNCKHLRLDDRTWYCDLTSTEKIDAFTGRATLASYATINDARNENGLCGGYGKWFEAKPPTRWQRFIARLH